MGQPGFFDLENRYAGLDAHGEPLVAIKETKAKRGLRGRFHVRIPALEAFS